MAKYGGEIQEVIQLNSLDHLSKQEREIIRLNLELSEQLSLRQDDLKKQIQSLLRVVLDRMGLDHEKYELDTTTLLLRKKG